MRIASMRLPKAGDTAWRKLLPCQTYTARTAAMATTTVCRPRASSAQARPMSGIKKRIRRLSWRVGPYG
jgi:hypothetical protein